MNSIHITVKTPSEFSQSLLSKAKLIDNGNRMETEPELVFESWNQLISEITAKRLEMLKYCSEHSGKNIRQISDGLKRDYKNVHNDVIRLCQLGLLTRTENKKVFAVYDKLLITADLAHVA